MRASSIRYGGVTADGSSKMKKAIANHQWMRGRLRVLESQTEEMEVLRQQYNDRKQTLQAIALELRSDQRSLYIRRRLDGLLSAVKRLDTLNRSEAEILRDLNKYTGRLLDTDLVDHFSYSLQRRVHRILKSHTGPRIRADVIAKPLWYHLKVGDLHVALHGRLRVLRRSGRRLYVKLRPGSDKQLRIFPGTDAFAGPQAPDHRYTGIFSTSDQERVVIHCDEISILPSLFRPEDLTHIEHPDFKGRMKYGGCLLHIWKPGAGK